MLLAVCSTPLVSGKYVSIMEAIQKLRLTTLQQALTTLQISTPLANATVVLTMLAPTEAAFDNLLLNLRLTKQQLFANPQLLRDVITYHLIPGTAYTTPLLTEGMRLPTQQGQTVSVTIIQRSPVFQGYPFDNFARITKSNVVAGKAILQVVDRVLLPNMNASPAPVSPPPPPLRTSPPPPPTVNPQTYSLYQSISMIPELTSLLAAINAAGLADVLKNPALTFTLFAPTNAAFNQLLAAQGITLQALLAHPALATILTYHIIPAALSTGQMNSGQILGTLQGGGLTTTFISSGALVVTGAQNSAVALTINIVAGASFMNTIGQVLMPPGLLLNPPSPPPPVVYPSYNNLMEALTLTPDLSIMRSLLSVNPSLVAMLSSPAANMMILAPNDAAWNAYLAQTKITLAALIGNINRLVQVLSYHSASGGGLSMEVLATFPPANLQLPTSLAGKSLIITTTNGAITFKGDQGTATIVSGNIGGGGRSYLHVVNGVLIPRM